MFMRIFIPIALLILLYACSNENQNIGFSNNNTLKEDTNLESDTITNQTNNIIDISMNLDSHKLVISKTDNIDESNVELYQPNKVVDTMRVTIESFTKYADPCNNWENDSTFYAAQLNKRILNFNSLKLNTSDTSYYFNGKLYDGIVKVIDPEYGDGVEGNQYYTLSIGRLNGPFYQQIAEGSWQLFGHYQNGKRHGSFTKYHGDLECLPIESVKYNMGTIQEGGDIEFLDHLF